MLWLCLWQHTVATLPLPHSLSPTLLAAGFETPSVSQRLQADLRHMHWSAKSFPNTLLYFHRTSGNPGFWSSCMICLLALDRRTRLHYLSTRIQERVKSLLCITCTSKSRDHINGIWCSIPHSNDSPNIEDWIQVMLPILFHLN